MQRPPPTKRESRPAAGSDDPIGQRTRENLLATAAQRSLNGQECPVDLTLPSRAAYLWHPRSDPPKGRVLGADPGRCGSDAWSTRCVTCEAPGTSKTIPCAGSRRCRIAQLAPSMLGCAPVRSATGHLPRAGGTAHDRYG